MRYVEARRSNLYLIICYLKVFSKTLCWVGLLMGLAWLSGCGRPAMSPSGCNLSSDCQPGEQCSGGVCTDLAVQGCLDNSECSLSFECIDGACVPSAVPDAAECGSTADCLAPEHCDLSQGICVECLLDEHCPLGETCLEGGICSSIEADPSSLDDDPELEDPSSPEDPTQEDPGPVEDCIATASDETGGLCSDGIDNDCDGEPDRFDASCPGEDCGEPSNYLTTDICNSALPQNHGARICEIYPHSNAVAGNRELCMDVCRTTSDCGAGKACYVSRRSINVHFCAPVLGPTLHGLGQACSSDTQCASAACHGGFCREVCVRDADCGGDRVCRATILVPEHLGQEAATGLCLPRDPTLLAPGEPCSAASQCQNGACGQPYLGGGYFCSKICGSDYDCGAGQRCAAALYSADTVLGHGLRTCSDQPASAIAQAGDYCSQASDCTTQICDGTYYHPDGEFLLAPYCNRYCDSDSDCPLLFPGTSPESYNLAMKCIVTSSAVIAPLVGGHCAPWWCNSTLDCAGDRACLVFNPSGFDGMPAGICQ